MVFIAFLILKHCYPVLLLRLNLAVLYEVYPVICEDSINIVTGTQQASPFPIGNCSQEHGNSTINNLHRVFLPMTNSSS